MSQLSEKLVEYFQVSLQRTLTPFTCTSYERSGHVEHTLVTVRERAGEQAVSD